ncbi:MAG: hypothetical protein ABR498_09615 [Candidatus Dormibacteria bacterium]
MTEIGEERGPGSVEERAARAVKQDTLLEGEDPQSPYIDDAEHWIAVYRELIQFKESVLSSTASELAELEHREARIEAKHVDVAILAAELERFRRRLAFWQERYADLCKRGSTS